MLTRIRKAKEENEGGFTLIELLVVVVIIGILAAIAIPTFLNQREKAWERAAQSDIRNAAVKMEEYFSDNGSYMAAGTTPGGQYAFKTSEATGETITIVSASAAAGFCLSVDHPKIQKNGAAQPDYVYSSTDGRPKQATTC